MNFASWLMRRWFGKFTPWRWYKNYVESLARNPVEWVGWVFTSIPYTVGVVSFLLLTDHTLAQAKEVLWLNFILYMLSGVVLFIHVQYLHYDKERRAMWQELSKKE